MITHCTLFSRNATTLFISHRLRNTSQVSTNRHIVITIDYDGGGAGAAIDGGMYFVSQLLRKSASQSRLSCTTGGSRRKIRSATASPYRRSEDRLRAP